MTVVGGAAWWVTPGRWGESVWPQLQGSRTRYWFFSPFFEVWWKVQSFEAQLKCSHRSLFKYLYPIILSTKMSGRVKYQVNKWSIAGVLVCMYYTSTKVSLNRLPKWLPVTCPLRTQFTAAVRTCGTHHYSLGQHRPVPAWLFLLICLFIYCLSIFFLMVKTCDLQEQTADTLTLILTRCSWRYMNEYLHHHDKALPIQPPSPPVPWVTVSLTVVSM